MRELNMNEVELVSGGGSGEFATGVAVGLVGVAACAAAPVVAAAAAIGALGAVGVAIYQELT